MRWKALVLCTAAIGSPLVAEEETSGVVVEEVTPGFAAAAAGLQPGDVLRRWERAANPPANPEPANGMILHPFDLWAVEIEQAPRGIVTLFGGRSEEPLKKRLGAGKWRMETRPQLPAAALLAHTRARELAASSEPEAIKEALELWTGLAESLTTDRPTHAGWLYFEKARVEQASGLAGGGEESFGRTVAAVKRGSATRWLGGLQKRWGETLEPSSRWGRMEELYQAALGLEREESLSMAAILNNLGALASYRGDLAEAERFHQEALAIRRRLAPQSLGVAWSLHNLGGVARRRGELEAAGERYEAARLIKERLVPGSTDLASTLNGLGSVARTRGELELAASYHSRSLEIQEAVAPDSLETASYANNLGVVAFFRGELVVAQGLYHRSLRLKERLAPGSLSVASTLNNLGGVAWRRGDLAAAEALFLRSLAIREKLAPGALGVAMSLSNIGLVAWERGDPTAAEVYFSRALAIRERRAPESIQLSQSLNNAGLIAKERGKLAEAEAFFLRSLELNERLAPEGVDVASALDNLAEIEIARGEFAAAKGYYQRAATIRERLAPQGLALAKSFANLATIAGLQADSLTEGQLLRRALKIRQELSPGSSAEAETLHRLARLYRSEQPAEALELFRRALVALETQAGRLGGDRESRTSFLARFGVYYRDTVALLIEKGLEAEAFHVLERSRVRGLLAMLAERDLVFSDLPEGLRRERREANKEHDRVLSQLGDWSALQEDADAMKAELRQQLSAVRQRQSELQARIRAERARLAALQHPQPLTLAETREGLDPGTLILSYSLGEKRSHLFVVGRAENELAVVPLQVTLHDTRELVRRFREMWKPGGPRDAWVKAQASELGEKLLGPAAAWIRTAERLVIIPEGPLHYLSFAALKDPGIAEGFRYLVESKPVSVVASATLLGQLKGERKGVPSAIRVAAFADPLFPGTVSQGKIEEPVLRSAMRDGLKLQPLPGTRAEVKALERFYPERAMIFVGAAAKEETAKSLGTEASILHFATHGLVDENQPLSSALALSIPDSWEDGQDNGLLQAWEIFEQVRLDADLVTLSGCETALGKEGGGEGLLGLTRAFQYAGARTVLASLWAVSDASTAALMERFYRHLRSGKSKDQALRAAQLELLAGPIAVGEGEARREVDFSHPFFWAPFQVIGDWQ